MAALKSGVVSFIFLLSILITVSTLENTSENSIVKVSPNLFEIGPYVIKLLFNAFYQDLSNNLEKVSRCIERELKGFKKNPYFRVDPFPVLDQCTKGTGLGLVFEGIQQFFPKTFAYLYVPLQLSKGWYKVRSNSYLQTLTKAMISPGQHGPDIVNGFFDFLGKPMNFMNFF